MSNSSERIWKFGRSHMTVLDRIAIDGNVIMVDDLADMDPSQLTGQTSAVVYVSKGWATHVEIICRTRGVHLLHVSELGDGGSISLQRAIGRCDIGAFRNLQSGFQVSIAGSDDLEGLDLTRVRSVFIRMEHLMYRAIQLSGMIPRSPEVLAVQVRDEIAILDEALPGRIRLLVRGLDLRSDDVSLAPLFRRSPEPNPELGVHGLRYLLENPEWVSLEREILATMSDRTSYAVPFVTSEREYRDFERSYAPGLPSLSPFIESPGALRQIVSLSRSATTCSVGLKDVAQLYFGADRGNSQTVMNLDLNSREFVRFVADSVSPMLAGDCHVAIYQSLDMLDVYARALGTLGWKPSIAAAEFKLMTEACNMESAA
ncbi:putative PEP-binding protein [Nocardioides sp. W7]|uniref:putative PEP-binding protein n=1 Tax=Nocardioides sp. W7 TaxID=2931390 RepID=UPI001FD3009D|nr:putative PEP-binding protein [Nocardioides sp. W7]